VGHIVPDHWAFARYITYACHLDTPSIGAVTAWRLPYCVPHLVNSFRRTSPPLRWR
jgi:hypothetical protein